MYNKKLLIGIGLFVLVCVIVICAIFYSSSEKKGNKTRKQRTEQTSTEQTPTEQTSADVSSPIDANDAETNFLTGKKYYDGDGVERNYSTAVTYFRAAAEKGHAKAQYNLGICYYKGHGVDPNITEAVRYFRLAAEQNDVYAQYMLGFCLYITKNCAEAIQWYIRAANNGLMEAQYALGYYYYNGEGVEQDYNKAVHYFKLAADQGNGPAQYMSGLCYYNGTGVPKNYIEAVRYFVLAETEKSYVSENPFKTKMQDEIADKEHEIFTKIANQLNGARIVDVQMVDFEMSQEENGRWVNIYTIKFDWSGRFDVTGSFNVKYEYYVSADAEIYKDHKIVDVHNPTIHDVGRSLLSWADNYISQDDCDIKKRIENYHRIPYVSTPTATGGSVQKVRIETFDESLDTGINFANIKAFSIYYTVTWSRPWVQKNGWTTIGYTYNVLTNAEFKYSDSGVIDTNDILSVDIDKWIDRIKSVCDIAGVIQMMRR